MIYDAMPSNDERLRYLNNPEYVFTSTKDVMIQVRQERKRKNEKEPDLLPSDS